MAEECLYIYYQTLTLPGAYVANICLILKIEVTGHTVAQFLIRVNGRESRLQTYVFGIY
jgi:hypothetical protein